MAEIVDLIHRVMVSVTGAPEPLAIEAYRNAAREFFTQTKAWRDPVSIAAYNLTTGEYQLTAGVGEEVFNASLVGHSGARVIRVHREQLERYRTRLSGTAIQYYAVTREGTIRVAPDPGTDESANMMVYGVVRPTTDALTIEDEIVAEYGTIIEQGALAALLAMPGQSWTAPETALLHRQNFDVQIEDWLMRAAHSGMDDVPRRAPMTTRGGS